MGEIGGVKRKRERERGRVMRTERGRSLSVGGTTRVYVHTYVEEE